jgi:hypothetical protein
MPSKWRCSKLVAGHLSVEHTGAISAGDVSGCHKTHIVIENGSLERLYRMRRGSMTKTWGTSAFNGRKRRKSQKGKQKKSNPR